ncbi:hypothetical protein AAFF_G00430240 [Aldrovandia affinis]|uniref:Uncharacterized protein n=1 Tax=Aldrovandia affinis TaxID=143900 RepID=A0AAD7S914_9TELE|nr:hypothetical protein AAFF_G00430240 [Aldrovandia affinis]
MHKSIHCHLNRFIPGTSVNTWNFQLYLLESLDRWNQDWGAVSVIGEVIGVDYLLRQTGQPLQNVDPDSEETEEILEDLVEEEEEDEGLEEDHTLTTQSQVFLMT